MVFSMLSQSFIYIYAMSSSFSYGSCNLIALLGDALLDPDTLVEFEGGSCCVHSCVVAARCGYFASLFSSGEHAPGLFSSNICIKFCVTYAMHTSTLIRL